ncbi:MAG: DUF2490 domain-containing protein [Bacteroidota bacterium]|nr:DUF2490 domain-containing protein [Bacteroidota bacterium]
MQKTRIFLFILTIFFTTSTFAQNGPSTWFELEFSKKIVKNLKVEFNPELRLHGGFEMDTYILEGGLSYKLHKYLTLAGYYRYENEYNYREKRQIYEWEPSNRFAFDARSGFELKRFDFKFRVRYTNGSDFDQTSDSKKSYFRYRAKVDYNIKGSKFTPFVSAEAFHDLIFNDLDKIRYTTGLAYSINKKNEIGLFYRLQDYIEPAGTLNKKESINIVGIGYSLGF